MSWLFSRALAEAFSAATSSDGVPSAPLSVMPTQHKFWRNDKTMESSRLSQFGLTCAVLTEDLGAGLLTWFLADSRVRTYQLPGMAPGSTVSAQDSGEKWHESSVRYDRDSSSWRTHRSLFEEDLPWSSVTLPSWGMTLDGVLWEPPTSGRPISGTASGSWPTPTASLGTKGGRVTPRKGRNGGTLIEAVSARSFPTPRASDSKRNASPGELNRKTPSLAAVIQRWPTPICNDAIKRGDLRKTPQYLAGAAQVADGKAGQLNPTWVEWLMGWPLEWTALQPLGMARFQEWLQQHSPISHPTGSEEAA